MILVVVHVAISRSEIGIVVVATGDSAALIMDDSSSIDRLEPDLTLEGLRLVYERNQARRR